jgi:O-antigen ligase
VFIWAAIVVQRWSRSGRVFRYGFAPFIFLLLVAGNLGSLSRTGQAGLLAGLAAVLLGRARSWPILFLVAPMAYLVYILAFTDAQSVLDLGFANRWTGAADNFPDRVIKWVAMFDFQRDHPLSFLTGSGFNSPNPYVLYMFSGTTDLGNVLAVDNGYVRRLFEIGIIGTALYFLFLGRMFLALWSTRYSSIAAGTFVAMATIAMAIESFQVTQTAIAFFLFCGVTLGLSARERTDVARSA